MKNRLGRLLYGDAEELEGRYSRIYGSKEGKEKAAEHRRKLRMVYLTIAVAFAVLCFLSMWTEREKAASVHTEDDGRMVYIDRPDAGESAISIDARVSAVDEKGGVSSRQNILIEPEGDGEEDNLPLSAQGDDRERTLNQKISTAVTALNEDRTKARVKLPSRLDDGTGLIWQQESSSNVPVTAFAFVLLFFAVYSGRFNGVKREEAKARESILKGLPGFTNKLVLLLNAGMVVSAAFDRIMEDYGAKRLEREKQGSNSEDYFYDRLYGIYTGAKEANAPMHTELKLFGKRSGVRELMRIADIIDDNVNKGSDLVTKLRREAEGLWFSRKKLAEEKGKIAETKLTAPLVILLLVLVMITVSPAMMEM